MERGRKQFEEMVVDCSMHAVQRRRKHDHLGRSLHRWMSLEWAVSAVYGFFSCELYYLFVISIVQKHAVHKLMLEIVNH